MHSVHTPAHTHAEDHEDEAMQEGGWFQRTYVSRATSCKKKEECTKRLPLRIFMRAQSTLSPPIDEDLTVVTYGQVDQWLLAGQVHPFDLTPEDLMMLTPGNSTQSRVHFIRSTVLKAVEATTGACHGRPLYLVFLNLDWSTAPKSLSQFIDHEHYRKKLSLYLLQTWYNPQIVSCSTLLLCACVCSCVCMPDCVFL